LIDYLIPFLEEMVRFGGTWGPALVFLFMTVESSFIPFPSEIVMIPAGFMAARGEFYPQDHVWAAVALAIACGIAGSLMGAWINYYLSLKMGRPFLHRWGKHFFLSPQKLDRAEALFRKYGDVTTFVCRLVPVVRQLISIPAGISRMPLSRFSLFTAAGAGIWVLILAFLGYWLGTTTEGLGYGELVHEGKALVKQHLLWFLLGGGLLIAAYYQIHRMAVGKKTV
jgi:membrane protein DedA with SNARE-associated domain